MNIGNQQGQVMILSAFVITLSLITVTAISGIIMTFQLRQTSDVENSAKAFYAADTGVEWRMYRCLIDNGYSHPTLSNNAAFKAQTQASGVLVSAGGYRQSARQIEVEGVVPPCPID
jgi:hypothetical protein